MKRNHSLPFFLVASPNVVDSQFGNAVILLLEHDEEGALGFVFNHRSDMTMNDVVAYDEMEIPAGIPVWNAGPVDSSSGFVLHNSAMDTFEQEIAPGVCLSASQDSLKKLIDAANTSSFHLQEFQKKPSGSVRYPYRLLIGYAGWAPGQLEDEMKVGSWLQAPLNVEILFNTSHEHIWQLSLASVGIKQSACLAPSPADWLH